jgi:hypothetical protein
MRALVLRLYEAYLRYPPGQEVHTRIVTLT